MDIGEYLKDPCGMLSVPYWKAKALTIPDSVRIIHSRDWNGQYRVFQRYFRIKHDLRDLPPVGFDYSTISLDHQAARLSEMINASYRQENIVLSEEEILAWKAHETYHEDLCVCISADDGKMIASGIAEYDAACREGTIEWVQVLPEYRRRGLGKKITAVLLRRLRDIGAGFATVSGKLDSPSHPLEMYRACGFTGSDIWYICRE
jgi:GNAT superfamily N-acetyltransferase